MIKSEDFMIYSLLMVDQAYSFNRESYGGVCLQYCNIILLISIIFETYCTVLSYIFAIVKQEPKLR